MLDNLLFINLIDIRFIIVVMGDKDYFRNLMLFVFCNFGMDEILFSVFNFRCFKYFDFLNNVLKILIDNVCKMRGLVLIIVCYNEIIVLFEKISVFKKLEKFYVFNNGFMSFSLSLGCLVLLCDLNMLNNKIILLLDNFGDLNKLINMDFLENEFFNFLKD